MLVLCRAELGIKRKNDFWNEREARREKVLCGGEMLYYYRAPAKQLQPAVGYVQGFALTHLEELDRINLPIT